LCTSSSSSTPKLSETHKFQRCDVENTNITKTTNDTTISLVREDVVVALENFGLQRQDILSFASSLKQKGLTSEEISTLCMLLIKNAKPKTVNIQEYNKLKVEVDKLKKIECELSNKLQKMQQTIEEKDNQLKFVTGISYFSFMVIISHM
jgi:hypothetical protein